MSDSLFNIWINILTSLPAWIPEPRLWLAPVLSIGLGILVGLAVEKIMVGTVRTMTKRVSQALGNRIAETFGGSIIWLFGLWGAYMATYVIEGLNSSMIELVRRVITTVLMLIVIQIISRIAVSLMRFYMNRTRELQVLPNTSIFENIARGVIMILGAIMVLQTVGISVGPLITALGIGGLAVSLALKDTLDNIFAGINIILSRQIRIGTYVKLEANQEGTIQDIGWRYTTLRTALNGTIVVPNVRMASNIVSTQDFPALDMILSVNLAYDTDLQQAESIALETAQSIIERIEGGNSRMPSQIRFANFSDLGIRMDIQLFPRTSTDQALVKHEVIKTLYERFQHEDIKIAYNSAATQTQATALMLSRGEQKMPQSR